MRYPQRLSDHDFLELYHEGLMDIEIAEIMDVSVKSVNNRRHRMGLPKNRQHSRSAKRYKVHNGETGEFVMEGTVWDIEQQLDLCESTIRSYAWRTKQGIQAKYGIVEVGV